VISDAMLVTLIILSFADMQHPKRDVMRYSSKPQTNAKNINKKLLFINARYSAFPANKKLLARFNECG
jgi:hypothetical protein